MIVSKVAAGAATGIALYPCRRDDAFSSGGLAFPEPFPLVHDVCAGTMFLILAFFCYVFFQHARAKGHREARRRATVYAVCGFTIAGILVVLGVDHFVHPALTAGETNLTFYGEWAGLAAFGVSWLTASRTLPFLTQPDERHHPLDGPRPEAKGRASAAAA